AGAGAEAPGWEGFSDFSGTGADDVEAGAAPAGGDRKTTWASRKTPQHSGMRGRMVRIRLGVVISVRVENPLGLLGGRSIDLRARAGLIHLLDSGPRAQFPLEGVLEIGRGANPERVGQRDHRLAVVGQDEVQDGRTRSLVRGEDALERLEVL